MLQIREYLEKHYSELPGKECIKLALKALMESVEAGSKNVEVSISGPVILHTALACNC